MILIKEPCMLHKHFMITLPNYSDLDAQKTLEIKRNSIDYLFKFINASTFKTNLKNIAGTNIVMPAQKTLISKGCITKDLKLHLLQRCANVKPEKVGDSNKLFNKLTDLQIKNLTKLSTKAILDKRELDSLILKCLDNCRVYTKKFVRHSMTFLIKTGEHHYEDMCNLFLLEGLQALLFVYPRFENELHATNIMKATIHNIGQNYIETHTRLKRNRYDENGKMRVDSFTSINSESGEVIEKLFSGEDSDCRLFTKDNSEITQLESAIVDLSSKYSGRKAIIVKLLMGEYDKDFTKYLNLRGTTQYANDDYFEHAKITRYTELIFDYLNYDKTKGYAFIERLKHKLKDYN